MVVVISSKQRFQGTVTPSDLNVETTVVEVTGAEDDYIIEGYLDLSPMESGDIVIVTEYIAVDGVNYRVFIQGTFSGTQDQPVLRFHTKTLLYNMKYKVTITQTSGTPKSFPYAFIMEVQGIV